MAQITNVTSESLQAKLRELLPSQQGFGEDLQASNVILPIIDLTETASGSILRQDLQSSINFGGATVFYANNSTETIASTGGFYRIIAGVSTKAQSSTDVDANFVINDGTTDKIIYAVKTRQNSNTPSTVINVDFVFFLRSTDTFRVTSSNINVNIRGSVRQLADITGNLINPTGFTSE